MNLPIIYPSDLTVISRANWSSKQKIRMIQFDQPYQDSFYLPLAIGNIMAHCIQDEDFNKYYDFHDAVWSRPPTEKFQSFCCDAAIFGFSLYVWNRQITHKGARLAKKNNPYSITIFGGPEAPGDSEAFLRKYSYIDYVVFGEGEQTFLELTKAIREKTNLLDVPGISFLRDGQYFKTSKRDKMDLANSASSYLSGIYDHIIANHKNDLICGIETNRGCPYGCTFCYWGGHTNSKVRAYSLERVYGELEWFSKQKIPLLWLLDANFGMLKRDTLLKKIYVGL